MVVALKEGPEAGFTLHMEPMDHSMQKSSGPRSYSTKEQGFA